MPNVFSKAPIPKLRRSYFNNSHDVKFNCDMGQIIPFLVKHLLPGDFVKIGNEIVLRAQPLVAPIMHEVNVSTYYFVVPMRILFGEMKDKDLTNLDNEWVIADHDLEKFFTRGIDGKDDSVVLPRWIPTGATVVNDNDDGFNTSDVNVTTKDNGIYSLWDYMGMPVDVIPQGAFPVDFPKRAYNLVYNEYFRDQNFMPMIDVANSNKVMNACWKKDYFTSALPWLQRGPDVSLPLGTVTFSGLPVTVDSGSISTYVFTDGNISSGGIGKGTSPWRTPVSFNNAAFSEFISDDHNIDGSKAALIAGYSGLGVFPEGFGMFAGLPPEWRSVGILTAPSSPTLNGVVSGSTHAESSMSINDLRLGISIQHFLERNAIGGARYKEFLLAHFGVAPNDDRLQRPQFIGGSRSPVIISEVLQTSESTESSPQGNLSGHGITASKDYICKYHCLEYSVLLGVMVIKPRASYQQGIPREWLMRSRYDFYLPALANLGEQAIEQAELFATNSNNIDEYDNPVIFGYTGRYNEYRYTPNRVAGGMRSTFDFWHIGRKFGEAPLLNGEFLKMHPRKNIFMVQDEPGFIVDVGNILHTWRPLPYYPTPGLRRI